MSSRTPALRRRPARVIPSVLVCLAILAPAGYLVWAIVVRLGQGRWPALIADGAPAVLGAPLSDPAVLTVAVVSIVVGIVLVLCAVVPGRHRVSALQVPTDVYDGENETVLTHRGLAHIVSARTSRLDGVDSANAAATDRRVRLTVDSPLTDTSEVADQARTAAESAVQSIPFTRTPAVTVRPGRNRR